MMPARYPVKGRRAAMAAAPYTATTQTYESPPLNSLVIVGSAVARAAIFRMPRKLSQ